MNMDNLDNLKKNLLNISSNNNIGYSDICYCGIIEELCNYPHNLSLYSNFEKDTLEIIVNSTVVYMVSCICKDFSREKVGYTNGDVLLLNRLIKIAKEMNIKIDTQNFETINENLKQRGSLLIDL